MKVLLRAAILIALASQLVFALARADAAENGPAFSVLLFSRTAGFRHDSIAAGIAAIGALGERNNFRVDSVEDAKAFSDENLARYRAVIFMNTTGEVLDAGGQAAFERFIRRGGGFVGIHAASDTGYDWPWFGGLVGTYFLRHPAIQPATLKVADASHVSTRHLPLEWRRTDEWYDFHHGLDADVTVLIRIDETTYRGGRMGADHPMAWYHHYDGGRAWYTALGHTIASYAEPLFLEHLRGGILWAAGLAQD